MSDDKINSIKAPNHSITPNLVYYGTYTSVEFNGSWNLVQNKIKVYLNMYNFYETNKNINISNYWTLENCLFGAVSSTKNTDTDISTNILDMELDLIDMEVFHFLGLD